MGRNTPLTGGGRLPVSMGDEEEVQKPKKAKKPRQKAEQQPSAPDPRFFRPVKGRLTMRVDSDILAAYRATGPGFQKLMNKALRAGMPASRRKTVTGSPAHRGAFQQRRAFAISFVAGGYLP